MHTKSQSTTLALSAMPQAELLRSPRDFANDKISKKGMTIYATKSIDQFNPQDLQIGELLGTGGFCYVHKIKGIEGETTNNDWLHEDGKSRYAIKKLSAETKADEENFRVGMVDLVLEGRLLAGIQHENIIGLKGFSKLSGDSSYRDSDFQEGFGIVIECLTMRLDKKYEAWSRKWVKGTFVRIFCPCSKKNRDVARMIEDDKIYAATGIANALEYLHSNNIIYRDLKPENIGFDNEGKVKIFDFGLATEFKQDSNFKLTGKTGTTQYMAPEVKNSEVYDLSADVYSFGILFWEIMAMKKYYPAVGVSNGRPARQRRWPEELKDLMKECWADDRVDRPSFVYIKNRLESLSNTENDVRADTFEIVMTFSSSVA